MSTNFELFIKGIDINNYYLQKMFGNNFINSIKERDISFQNRMLYIIKNTISKNYLIEIVKNDCTLCMCSGCRIFDKNNNYITKEECKSYMSYFLSKEFDYYTDICWCKSCKEKRGDKNLLKIYLWLGEDDGNGIIIYSSSVQEAKKCAIKYFNYDEEDYIRFNYKIMEEYEEINVCK